MLSAKFEKVSQPPRLTVCVASIPPIIPSHAPIEAARITGTSQMPPKTAPIPTIMDITAEIFVLTEHTVLRVSEMLCKVPTSFHPAASPYFFLIASISCSILSSSVEVLAINGTLN